MNQAGVLVYTSGTTGNPKGVMLSQVTTRRRLVGFVILPCWGRRDTVRMLATCPNYADVQQSRKAVASCQQCTRQPRK